MPDQQCESSNLVVQRSIKIIDNLAEITSQHDRNILEQSLLKTLHELFQFKDFRLYRIRPRMLDKLDFSLWAYCANSVIISKEHKPERILPSDSELANAIAQAIEKADVCFVKSETELTTHTMFPAFDGNDDVFAVLLVTAQKRFNTDDQRLVGGILKVYSNYFSLIEKSQRDNLTGLYNRETLNFEISKLMMGEREPINVQKTPESITETRKPIKGLRSWLGVVDIDHFKSINDSFGHLYGDEVIILVARLMTSGCMREDDLVYRYGGEEFVILLKAASEEDAYTAFDRIRSLIETHTFPQLKQVTTSIGFVEVNNQVSPSDVIGEADDALYYAKQNGRNQVQSYHELLKQGKLHTAPPADVTDVELF